MHPTIGTNFDHAMLAIHTNWRLLRHKQVGILYLIHQFYRCPIIILFSSFAISELAKRLYKRGYVISGNSIR
jgi:hypothetical protein